MEVRFTIMGCHFHNCTHTDYVAGNSVNCRWGSVTITHANI